MEGLNAACHALELHDPAIKARRTDQCLSEGSKHLSGRVPSR